MIDAAFYFYMKVKFYACRAVRNHKRTLLDLLFLLDQGENFIKISKHLTRAVTDLDIVLNYDIPRLICFNHYYIKAIHLLLFCQYQRRISLG